MKTNHFNMHMYRLFIAYNQSQTQTHIHIEYQCIIHAIIILSFTLLSNDIVIVMQLQFFVESPFDECIQMTH